MKVGGGYKLIDPAPNYADELMRCQRDQYIFGSVFPNTSDTILGYAQSARVASFVVDFPIELRSIPTLAVKAPKWGFRIQSTNTIYWLNEHGASFSVAAAGRKTIKIFVTLNADRFTVGEPLILCTNEDTLVGAATKKYVGQLIFDSNP